MTHIKHLTISLSLTLALVAAVAAPALAYSTPNATVNSASAGEDSAQREHSSPNAILSPGGTDPAGLTEVSSPNAILGAANVAQTSVQAGQPGGTSGFDWSDALVGAGSATAVLFLTAGGLILARRRRSPAVQPSV